MSARYRFSPASLITTRELRKTTSGKILLLQHVAEHHLLNHLPVALRDLIHNLKRAARAVRCIERLAR